MQVAGERLIRALIALGLEHPHDRGALELGVVGEQLADAGLQARIDHQVLCRHGSAWAAGPRS